MSLNLPNKLTLVRVILVPFFVAVLLYDNGSVFALRIAALVIFCAASITDFLDGYIARKYHLVTNFGKFMDPLADKLLVCSALICFVQLGQLPAWIVLIVIGREFIISGFRLVASDQGIVIAASMWGKVKTCSQMAAIILLIINSESTVFQMAENTAVIIMTCLTVISLADYLMKNKQVLSEKKEA